MYGGLTTERTHKLSGDFLVEIGPAGFLSYPYAHAQYLDRITFSYHTDVTNVRTRSHIALVFNFTAETIFIDFMATLMVLLVAHTKYLL